MTVTTLTFISNLFFNTVNWGWEFIFPVITLGVACIPIRLALRHYA